MIKMYDPSVPTLHFDKGINRWVLSLETIRLPGEEEEEEAYADSMQIQCAWDGTQWFNYRFVRHKAGDWKELVTADQYRKRVGDCEEHEGSKVADMFAEMALEELLTVVPDDNPVFELREYWEAMIRLGLFFPAPTIRDWEGKNLTEASQRTLNDLRTAEMSASMDVEAAEYASETRAHQFAPERDCV